MKNKYLLLLVIPIPLLLISFSTVIPGIKLGNGDSVRNHYQFTDDYKGAWHKVDSLQNLGLTRSALEIVESIYDVAKKDHNQPQLIKAVFFKLKYANYTEEDSHVKIINDIKAEIDSASFPANSILNSILASIYWRYYQNNRWRFQQRTETINFDNEDFQTWDLPRLIREIVKYYTKSLENSDELKQIPIKEFGEILDYSNSGQAYLRPTLYDLLAHQALSFYINDEASVIDPIYKFELKNVSDFSPAKDFIGSNYTTKDSLSLKFYAIKLYQSLIKFHLDDNEKDPLIDVNLARLNFVRSNSVHLAKDSLYLNALIKMEGKYNDVPFSSLISFNKAKYYYDEGFKYNASISENHKWDLKTALEICNSTIEKFPDNFGTGECRWLKNNILQKSLQFQIESGNIPNQSFRALVSFKNVNKAFVRIIRWNESLEEKEKGKNIQELINFYSKQIPIKEWSIDLPDDRDYQSHSVEIKIPAIDVGQYLMLIATDKNFIYQKNAVGYGKTWVTNISYLRRNQAKNRMQFYTVNRKSGNPIANVEVEVYGKKYVPDGRQYKFFKVKSGKTDREGFFEFNKSKEANQYSNYRIILAKGEDRFVSQDFYSYYYPNNTVKRRMTFFFLDRAIYRPGQIVYFKGLLVNTDGKKDNEIITDQNTTVTLFDANSQQVAALNLKSNDYGSFNGKFTIPSGKIGGQYHIANEYGSKFFRVEEYKRPKFEVNFDPIKGSYSLNDNVTVTGFAKTYSGANLNDVEVKYRVVRTASFPYFYYWWRGYYDWYWNNNNQMEITNGTTQTDKDGKFNIEFDLIPDLSIPKDTKPIFNYTIYADVVDVTGETHSSQTSVRAGYVALLTNLNLPEIINSEFKSKYTISTTNLNGQFEPAKLSIEVYKLKEPTRIFRNRLWQKPDKFLITKQDYYESFPHDIYNDENEFFNWEKEEKVFASSFITTDSSKISFSDINGWKPGKYVITLNTTDKNGNPIELIKYFTLFNPHSDKIPLREASWIYTESKSYEPGEIARLLIGTAEDNVKALYEIEFNGEVIQKEWVSLDNEQKEFEIPIHEEYRGNLIVHVAFIVNNEAHIKTRIVIVPWSNKTLNISFETFRNKLIPGAEEEWRLKISGPKGDAVAAEFLTAMYDASLDAFAPNYWNFNVYGYNSPQLNWSTDNIFRSISSRLYELGWNTYISRQHIYYPYIKFFGFDFYSYGYGNELYFKSERMDAVEEVTVSSEKVIEGEQVGNLPTKQMDKLTSLQSGIATESKGKDNLQQQSFEGISVRKNLNETAFFYPELRTNDKGEIVMFFTVPEALTRWKVMGFAHTKDLKSSFLYNEAVTQKDLMIQPNPPRFLREGDEIYFTAKVTNLSDSLLKCSATLQLFNAFTMKPVDTFFENDDNVKNFSTEKGISKGLSWRLKVPLGKVDAVIYRVIAKSGELSDGEENALPIILNRMLVTETLPLPVKGNQTKTFILDKLMNNTSSTLQNYNLTLEFTSNPVWYAIQALPYMMEFPYECSEQIFNRFYANSIATFVANSNPKIKKVFESWKNIDKDALLSNLEKNQELKSALLEETPWVLDAQDESERKRRVGLLFDLTRMANELNNAEQKLRDNQYSNGGWPWFPGLPESRFITQYIVVGMGHLERLGIKDIRERQVTWEMLKKAVLYTDVRMYEDYERLKKSGVNMKKKHIGYIQAHYLYGRSYYMDIPVSDQHKEAFDYWKWQAQTYWLSNNKYMQGMIALALYRLYDAKTAKSIIKSIIENAVFNDEMGMYFKEEWGWYWYQAPIETQALLIEAVDEISKDQESVDLMKIWLLKQKQVQDWKTTKATAEACYALLLKGTNWLADSKLPDIKVGDQLIDLYNNPDIHIEEGTEYFKTSWKSEEIKPEMGKITVTNNNDVVAWGSLYWQYYEELDKITSAETPLKINKKLFLEIDSETGKKITPVTENTKLKPGDLIKVRIEIRVDRDMEFVHLKDMRASGFEPINVLSTHKYKDGLYYYENTRDLATNFFMDRLPKGTYVFEYPLRVTHKGNFSNGITTIQCMYAPEFTSHSEGVRVMVQ